MANEIRKVISIDSQLFALASKLVIFHCSSSFTLNITISPRCCLTSDSVPLVDYCLFNKVLRTSHWRGKPLHLCNVACLPALNATAAC